jgi:hypothetical protein
MTDYRNSVSKRQQHLIGRLQVSELSCATHGELVPHSYCLRKFGSPLLFKCVMTFDAFDVLRVMTFDAFDVLRVGGKANDSEAAAKRLKKHGNCANLYAIFYRT